MQAGVPIVPIVLRNTGDLLWKESLVVRPGKVDVTVLPPISVDGWKAPELDRRVAEVRQLYLDTLAGWPRGRTPTKAERSLRRASRASG
jgi:putative phosphoserine phosphatase / 1-acylglycerol-3-phosphate O-acyltransferase